VWRRETSGRARMRRRARPETFRRALRRILALPDVSRRHTVMRLLP